jgi:transcriptional regulator with XRE-family HTH domain
MSKTPIPEYVADVQATLALNLRARMAAFYLGLPVTSQAERLSKEAGVGKNTILRLIDDEYEGNPRLDVVARIAHAMQCSVTDLLVDHNKKNKRRSKVQSVVRTAAEPLKGALQRRTGS